MEVRVRLRPWLEQRLDEGCIDGLRWMDRDKGIFKIPWKHHSKHSWSESDAAIFKDWAVVTGRFREEVDQPDWPMWKTRLRCALNKAPDIQEVKPRHNLHCEDPFKVYRFVSKTESMWRANAARNASLVFDGVNNPVLLQRSDSTTNLILGNSLGHLSRRIAYFPKPKRFISIKNHGQVIKCSNINSKIVNPIEPPPPSSSLNQRLNSVQSLSPKLMEPEHHQIAVRLLHLNIRVRDCIITNPNGCCIYYWKLNDMHPNCTPDPIEAKIDEWTSPNNSEFVNLLLENMCRGLLVNSHKGSLFAERLCKCAVFVYEPSSTGGFLFRQKLGRRTPEKIFDYEQFYENLLLYKQGLRCKPSFEVVLTFGQQLRTESPSDSILIWARFASCRAWYQLQKVSNSIIGLSQNCCPGTGNISVPSTSTTKSLLSRESSGNNIMMSHNNSVPFNIKMLTSFPNSMLIDDLCPTLCSENRFVNGLNHSLDSSHDYKYNRVTTCDQNFDDNESGGPFDSGSADCEPIIIEECVELPLEDSGVDESSVVVNPDAVSHGGHNQVLDEHDSVTPCSRGPDDDVFLSRPDDVGFINDADALLSDCKLDL